ncbi:hypothetical protein A9Q99_17960 [Gammaproteobacteria bacterium 45_16_T64]|nr:hypothetical protein A9Q99_17960 [Gammaproteobacteria bacterium 45_16_T64]
MTKKLADAVFAMNKVNIRVLDLTVPPGYFPILPLRYSTVDKIDTLLASRDAFHDNPDNADETQQINSLISRLENREFTQQLLRPGWLYVYRDGHLFKEYQVKPEQDSCDKPDVEASVMLLQEVELQDEQGKDEREANGDTNIFVMVPETGHYEIAYSEFQWPWLRINSFGGIAKTPEDDDSVKRPFLMKGTPSPESDEGLVNGDKKTTQSLRQARMRVVDPAERSNDIVTTKHEGGTDDFLTLLTENITNILPDLTKHNKKQKERMEQTVVCTLYDNTDISNELTKRLDIAWQYLESVVADVQNPEHVKDSPLDKKYPMAKWHSTAMLSQALIYQRPKDIDGSTLWQRDKGYKEVKDRLDHNEIRNTLQIDKLNALNNLINHTKNDIADWFEDTYYSDCRCFTLIEQLHAELMDYESLPQIEDDPSADIDTPEEPLSILPGEPQYQCYLYHKITKLFYRLGDRPKSLDLVLKGDASSTAKLERENNDDRGKKLVFQLFAHESDFFLHKLLFKTDDPVFTYEKAFGEELRAADERYQQSLTLAQEKSDTMAAADQAIRSDDPELIENQQALVQHRAELDEVERRITEATQAQQDANSPNPDEPENAASLASLSEITAFKDDMFADTAFLQNNESIWQSLHKRAIDDQAERQEQLSYYQTLLIAVTGDEKEEAEAQGQIDVLETSIDDLDTQILNFKQQKSRASKLAQLSLKQLELAELQLSLVKLESQSAQYNNYHAVESLEEEKQIAQAKVTMTQERQKLLEGIHARENEIARQAEFTKISEEFAQREDSESNEPLDIQVPRRMLLFVMTLIGIADELIKLNNEKAHKQQIINTEISIRRITIVLGFSYSPLTVQQMQDAASLNPAILPNDSQSPSHLRNANLLDQTADNWRQEKLAAQYKANVDSLDDVLDNARDRLTNLDSIQKKEISTLQNNKKAALERFDERYSNRRSLYNDQITSAKQRIAKLKSEISTHKADIANLNKTLGGLPQAGEITRTLNALRQSEINTSKIHNRIKNAPLQREILKNTSASIRNKLASFTDNPKFSSSIKNRSIDRHKKSADHMIQVMEQDRTRTEKALYSDINAWEQHVSNNQTTIQDLSDNVVATSEQRLQAMDDNQQSRKSALENRHADMQAALEHKHSQDKADLNKNIASLEQQKSSKKTRFESEQNKINSGNKVAPSTIAANNPHYDTHIKHLKNTSSNTPPKPYAYVQSIIVEDVHMTAVKIPDSTLSTPSKIGGRFTKSVTVGMGVFESINLLQSGSAIVEAFKKDTVDTVTILRFSSAILDAVDTAIAIVSTAKLQTQISSAPWLFAHALKFSLAANALSAALSVHDGLASMKKGDDAYVSHFVMAAGFSLSGTASIIAIATAGITLTSAASLLLLIVGVLGVGLVLAGVLLLIYVWTEDKDFWQMWLNSGPFSLSDNRRLITLREVKALKYPKKLQHVPTGASEIDAPQTAQHDSDDNESALLEHKELRHNIQFSHDSSVVSVNEVHTLRATLQHLLAPQSTGILPSSVHIDVIGHSNKIGSIEHNQILSAERANAVQNTLLQLGFHENVSTTALGELDPTRPCDTEDDLILNRRVEVIVSYTQEVQEAPVDDDSQTTTNIYYYKDSEFAPSYTAAPPYGAAPITMGIRYLGANPASFTTEKNTWLAVHVRWLNLYIIFDKNYNLLGIKKEYVENSNWLSELLFEKEADGYSDNEADNTVAYNGHTINTTSKLLTLILPKGEKLPLGTLGTKIPNCESASQIEGYFQALSVKHDDRSKEIVESYKENRVHNQWLEENANSDEEKFILAWKDYPQSNHEAILNGMFPLKADLELTYRKTETEFLPSYGMAMPAAITTRWGNQAKITLDVPYFIEGKSKLWIELRLKRNEYHEEHVDRKQSAPVYLPNSKLFSPSTATLTRDRLEITSISNLDKTTPSDSRDSHPTISKIVDGNKSRIISINIPFQPQVNFPLLKPRRKVEIEMWVRLSIDGNDDSSDITSENGYWQPYRWKDTDDDKYKNPDHRWITINRNCYIADYD